MAQRTDSIDEGKFNPVETSLVVSARILRFKLNLRHAWRRSRNRRQSSRLLLARLLIIGFCLIFPLSLISPAFDLTVQSVSDRTTETRLLGEGKSLYEQGKFSEAEAVLKRAVQTYEAEGDQLGQAIAQSNLSLVYKQLGRWSEANQQITSSLELLQKRGKQQNSRSDLKVLAQILDIQGRIQFDQGHSQQALATWEQTSATFTQIGDEKGVAHSRINQAQALQTLGLYRRAIAVLTQVTELLKAQPDSLTQVVGLRSFGDALRVAGELEQAREVLQKSLTIAEQMRLPEPVASAQLSLGNTMRALGDTDAALKLYDKAANGAGSVTTRTQAKLNQLSLFLETKQWSTAAAIGPSILAQLDQMPPSRPTVYARINFAQSLLQLRKAKVELSPLDIAQVLSQARQQARELADRRAESYALGSLGTLYEQTQQGAIAEELTQQALALAQANNSSDAAFRWQWQLGRLLKTQGKTQAAIAAYTEAVKTLQSLRSDLVAINPEVQFSFRDNVEPIYRQLVELLLDSNGGKSSSMNLEAARQTIESLQLAELDNFFREACLSANPVLVDQVDQQAAVLYPIILPDRLAVLLSLPGQPPRYYSTSIAEAQVGVTVDRLRLALGQRNSPRFMPLAQQIYDWLIRPAAADLAANQVKTLVFVLDGILRNIPMAVLHDGDRYLTEQYNIALTPGLQLLNTRPLPSRQFKVLTAGLTEARQGFPALPYVRSELSQIDTQVAGRTLLDQGFTSQAFQSAVGREPFPIIHLATHGQFSSKLDKTFLLTWDDRLDVNQLRSLLQATELDRTTLIELLVLSASETAAGDKRAALGLAGIATRAGARSTLATLWSVNDQATAVLMERFYQELGKDDVTKAEALRRAQQRILQDPQYRQHPYYWAAFVLVGNWL